MSWLSTFENVRTWFNTLELFARCPLVTTLICVGRHTTNWDMYMVNRRRQCLGVVSVTSAVKLLSGRRRLLFFLNSFHYVSDFDQHNLFQICFLHKVSLSTGTFAVETVLYARDTARWSMPLQRRQPETNVQSTCGLFLGYIGQSGYRVDDAWHATHD